MQSSVRDDLSQAITKTITESILILDKGLRVTFANKSFYETFQATPEETEGTLVYELGNGQWNIPQLKVLLEEILPKASFFENFEVQHDFSAIGHKTMLLNARRLRQKTDREPVILVAIEDISERKELEDKLADYTSGLEVTVAKRTKSIALKQARYEAILDSIGDGLIVAVDVDKGGKIIYVNKAFEEMVGWQAQDVVDKYMVDVIPREDRYGKVVPFNERLMTRMLSEKKTVSDLTQTFYYVRRDKSRFPVASVITPVFLHKKLYGAVETFRDITRENVADKAKTEFSSLVSHQLRTPFSTINWYIELLLSGDVGKLSTKQTQYLQEAYRASQRMVTLINVLLSISRIEMGITTMEVEPTDIVALVEMILKENKLTIQKKKLTIGKAYDKTIPQLQVDPKQLAMVLQNLLSNAIKYTPADGEIHVKLGCNKDGVTVAIADTGIGIPKDAQPGMFTRFFRADNAKAQDSEGTGLGLYIVKAIIDQMGGKIWFKSRVGQGTTFYVRLPLKVIAKQRQETA